MSSLEPDATLEEVAAAFSRPMIRALAEGGRDLDVMRIVSRAAMTRRRPRIGSTRAFNGSAQSSLAVADDRPRGERQRLAFRTRCAAGVIAGSPSLRSEGSCGESPRSRSSGGSSRSSPAPLAARRLPESVRNSSVRLTDLYGR